MTDEREEERIELPTRQGYDRWSAIYDEEDNPLVMLEHKHFEQIMNDVCSLRVLDAGCGTGRHAISLAQRGAKVTAMDFSEGMLARARSKPGSQAVEFVQHDLESPLPLSSQYFDRIVSGLVIDHINDLGRFFSELRRVCKPTGFVLITVMHPAMSLRGVQARFTDPDTGCLVLPASRTHAICDYVMAALEAGFAIRRMGEYAVDEALIGRSERARRYLGWPLLLLLELTAQPVVPSA